MDIDKLTVEGVMKEVGAPPSAQELSLVPKEQQMLFTEMRINNNLLKWLIQHTVSLNNVVADHDKQLSPLRIVGKITLAVVAMSAGIAVTFNWIKALLKP